MVLGAELGTLTHLHWLALEDNPQLRIPPPEVVSQGTPAILAYLNRRLPSSHMRTLIGLGSLANGQLSDELLVEQLIGMMDGLEDEHLGPQHFVQAKHILQEVARSHAPLSARLPVLLHELEEAALDFAWGVSLRMDQMFVDWFEVTICSYKESFCYAISATLSARLGEHDALLKHAETFGRSFLAYLYHAYPSAASSSLDRARRNQEFEYARSFVRLLGAPLSVLEERKAN